jgi:hypothetical protein
VILEKTNMDIDQLFAELRNTATDIDRQALVNNAMTSGADPEQIREMLDYLECCDGGCKKESIGSKGIGILLRAWKAGVTQIARLVGRFVAD